MPAAVAMMKTMTVVMAVSRRLGHGDAVKLDDFWAASPHAAQRR